MPAHKQAAHSGISISGHRIRSCLAMISGLVKISPEQTRIPIWWQCNGLHRTPAKGNSSTGLSPPNEEA